MNNKKLIVVLGPTASGKSSLAVELASTFKGEIISADSRQIYKDFNLSSGKITKTEMKKINHHLLDIISPNQEFNISHYVKLAQEKIEAIQEKKKLPFLVGGSNFYIYGTLGEITIPEVPINKEKRIKWEEESTTELYKLLLEKDPRRARNIDKLNKRKLIRALEIIDHLKKVPITKKEERYLDLKLGIETDSSDLKRKIEIRLKERITAGMIEEIKEVRKKYNLSWEKLENLGLEFRYISYYLQNKISKIEMVIILKNKIWQYAKRQLTWLKKDQSINWIKNEEEARLIINSFLKKF